MSDRWIVVHNWDRFQRYKDRDPAWIKLYLELNARDDWLELTLRNAAASSLDAVWLEYAPVLGVCWSQQVRKSRIRYLNACDALRSLEKPVIDFC